MPRNPLIRVVVQNCEPKRGERFERVFGGVQSGRIRHKAPQKTFDDGDILSGCVCSWPDDILYHRFAADPRIPYEDYCEVDEDQILKSDGHVMNV